MSTAYDWFDLEGLYEEFRKTASKADKRAYTHMREDKVYESETAHFVEKETRKAYETICTKHVQSRKKLRRECDNSRKRNALRKERKTIKAARLSYKLCKRNLMEQAFIENANDTLTMHTTLRLGTHYNSLLNTMETLRDELDAINVYDPRFLPARLAKMKVELEHTLMFCEDELKEILAEMS